MKKFIEESMHGLNVKEILNQEQAYFFLWAFSLMLKIIDIL